MLILNKISLFKFLLINLTIKLTIKIQIIIFDKINNYKLIQVKNFNLKQNYFLLLVLNLFKDIFIFKNTKTKNINAQNLFICQTVNIEGIKYKI